MRAPPPEVVASWPPPNFENPDTQGARLPVVGIILVTLSFITVSLRLYVRLRIKRTEGYDDWILAAALPFVLTLTVLSILSTRFGFGLHIWDNKQEWETMSRVILYLLQILVVVIATLVKLSLLISYLRFFTSRLLHHVAWVMIALNLAGGIACTFVSIFACVPPQNYWVRLLGDAQGCQKEDLRMMIISSINIGTEFAVLVLPLPTLWRLSLPKKAKAVLIIVMSLGFTACLASTIRTRMMYDVLERTYDLTWTGYDIYLLVIVELNLGIICAAIPTLRPLVRRYSNCRWFGSSPRYPSGSSVPELPGEFLARNEYWLRSDFSRRRHWNLTD